MSNGVQGSEALHSRQGLRERILLGIAVLGLLLVIGVSAALAEGGDPAPQGGPSLSQVKEAIEDPGLQTVEIPHTDPQAAEELPHRDLNRDQANELLTEVFGTLLQGPAGIFDELEVRKFYSDNVALIAAGDQPSGEGAPEGTRPTLLESSLPLRAEDDNGDNAEIDLELEKSEGELQPENPLVDVEIPTQLGDGISLPQSEIGIELADAPVERSPSTVDPSVATYPNVAEDTTLVVAPTATGLETLTLLQSADAPTSQTFHLTLPNGAILRETEDGGAEVSRSGETVMAIRPPSAMDAEEDPVPVHLETNGDSLTITAEPGEESNFPILVDPMWETYYWFQHTTTSFAGWDSFSNSNVFTTSHNGQHDGVWDPGLQIGSGNTAITPGAQARWDYHVPRWATDAVKPTSFITRVIFEKLFFDVQAYANPPLTPDPFLAMYIWDENKPGFVSIGHRYGNEGNLTNMNYQYNLYNFPPPQENTDAKQVSLELVSSQTKSQYRQLYVGLAGIELSDVDFPAFGSLGNPSGWINNTSSPIPFAISDTGLGMKEMSVTQPLANGGMKKISTPYSPSCTGGQMSPCPRKWTSEAGPALAYDPSIMPQGENWIALNAFDPVNHSSASAPGAPPSEVKVKVDHTIPKLAPLSGTLTEQAKIGTSASQYTLKYSASDGDHEAPAPLSSFGVTGTGAGQFQRPIGIAIDGGGNLWVVDRENNRVEKFDENGTFLMQFGTFGSGNGQFKDPRSVAIAPSGTIWISDLGNKRVQAFNSKGEFIRSITYASFIEPNGLATGPGGVLWVSDPAAHRIFEFNENGTFIRKAYGSSANPNGESETDRPVGMATDAMGNLWVADNGLNRIIEFDSNGKYVSQFGSGGGANGQLHGPIAIAVAPSGHIFVVDSVNNRVQEFQPSGEYLRQFGTLGSGSGQLNEPRSIAVGAGNKVLVVDSGNRRVARWSHADFDPQSGVASTEVKVDGQLAEPKYAPGCATRDCTISREWTLKAGDYVSGQHNVQVTATDGVGLPTTKSLTITTVKDTTAPQLTANSAFFTAPEGWLEQKSYSYTASASDSGGYGVTSLIFKIDGSVIKSETQSCANGGCGASLSGSINMATYEGGAHPAELLATDAGGNSSKKAWTINIDPVGQVSHSEAIATLEAVDTTSPVNTVGEATEEEQYEGTVSGLGAVEAGDETEFTGNAIPTTVSQSPSAGITMQIPSENSFAVPCGETDLAEFAEELTESGEQIENSTDQPETCVPAESVEGAAMTPINISPVVVQSQVSDSELVGDNVVLTANTADQVDTVIRPLYDGALIFESLRAFSAPVTFSWDVELEPDQELRSIDDQHAAVYYSGGHPAFGISAQPAHDAVGTSVPTHLSISGDSTITLTVDHRAATYIYPVVAGTGWEGGFQTNIVEMPPPEIEPEEPSETELSEGGVRVRSGAIGPPIASISAAGSSSIERPFKFNECFYKDEPYPDADIVTKAKWDCHRNLNGAGVRSAELVNGNFHYKYGKWVWINQSQYGCHSWGKSATVDCWLTSDEPRQDQVKPVGYFRLPPGGYWASFPTCGIVGGKLTPSPPYVNELPYSWPIYSPYFAELYNVWSHKQPCLYKDHLSMVHYVGDPWSHVF